MSGTIHEGDLRKGWFSCCGDEDLTVVKCPVCGYILVICTECDTLFKNVNDPNSKTRDEVNHFDPEKPAFYCPRCGYAFEYYFVRNTRYAATKDDFLKADLGFLLAT